MKKMAVVLVSLFTMTSAFAALPSEIKKLEGKLGVFTSIFNGESVAAETGTDCKIEESKYGEGSVVIDSVAYFTPTAHLDGAKKSVKDGVTTFETTATGKRPGGSICGDYTPLTSYKQTVIVTKNSLTIKQKYACAIFDRNEIIESCTVK